MDLKVLSLKNEENLKLNTYPGRGIIIGMSPDGKQMYQIYWIMGRSENSRNRIFEKDGSFVRTRAFDESKMTDPSLIIYYPARDTGNVHIITNGDQTDTIYNAVRQGGTFEAAIYTRKYEPDAPNFTPRISGVVVSDKNKPSYKLSIIKTLGNMPEYCCHGIYSYDSGIPGYGHCIHTYKSDGNPLPSFEGEPYTVKIFGSIEKNAEYYWDLLDKENRVSLLVKRIDPVSNNAELLIVNKHS